MKLSGKLSLGPREKTALLLLGLVALFFWGYGSFASPQIERMTQTRGELLDAKEILAETELERPDIETLRKRIRSLQTKVSESFASLEALEEGLLYRQDVDLLLERVVSDRKRLKLTINAVEPMKPGSRGGEAPKDSAFYKGLSVRVDAFAAFDNLIAYLEALENQGPYQRVRAVQVKMEKKEKAQPRALILLESLLADTTEKRTQQKQRVSSMVQDISSRELKDPFLAKERPKEEKQEVGMTLSGVFGTGEELSALIDGQVYTIGDQVKGKQIVQIHPDRVVLERGNQRYLLYERQASQ